MILMSKSEKRTRYMMTRKEIKTGATTVIKNMTKKTMMRTRTKLQHRLMTTRKEGTRLRKRILRNFILVEAHRMS